MKRKLIIVGSSLGILVFAFGLAAYFSSQKKEPEIEKPPVPKKIVQTKSVRYDDIQTDIVAYGRVEPAQSLDLLAEVSGRMFQGKVRLKEGQNFLKGALLFYIDDREAAFELKSDKSNFLRDLASILPDLKLDFSDNYDVWNAYFNSLDIHGSFADLPRLKSEKERIFLATKGIFSSFYSIKSSEIKLTKHKFYAPFNGSITEVSLQSGSFVNPGARIGKIIRSQAHELKVAVESEDILWVQQNSPVKVYSDKTRQYWNGKVVRISDYINQNTQSVDVFIAIESNGQRKRIYDGQFFRAAIPAGKVVNGMILPRNAIYNKDEVFVVQDSLLAVRKVNVMRLMEENAIVNGLDEGTNVVIEQLIGAYNNMEVEKREQKEMETEIGKLEYKELLNSETAQTKIKK